jgi:hypothetical protein
MPLESLWIGLALGLAPYIVKRTQGSDGTSILEIWALGWSLYTAQRPDGVRDWTLRVMLIDWLRAAAAAAIFWRRER